MATNSYFRRNIPSEHRLIEDLTVETIKVNGLDMIYIPRTAVNRDSLFGEDLIAKFQDNYSIEMYLESVDGFEGEVDFMSRFGLQIRDSVNLVVAKKRFEMVVSRADATVTRPREGDIIYFPLSGGVFEIKFVEHENPFYQLGKLFTYKLSCELFTYNQEEFNTGDDLIDSTEDSRQQYVSLLTMGGVSGSTLDYYVGETVYQAGGTATVVDWSGSDSTTKLLSVSFSGGSFTNGQVVVGLASGTEYSLSSSATGSTVIVQDPVTGTGGVVAGQNEEIEFHADKENIFDFSEVDPFSEGNYS